MHERQKGGEHPTWTLEDEADILLSKGDINGADYVLRDLTGEYTNSHQFFPASFKLLALPLYQLAYYPSAAGQIDAANDTYGLIAKLMEIELDSRNNFPPDSKEKYRRIGRLSELTIFCLLLRDGIGDGDAVPVPASRQNDIYAGIDLHLSPMGTGSVTDGLPLQIKTSPTLKDRKDCAQNKVTLIAMKELDAYASMPDDADSLANSLLRELNGTASNEDSERLSQATTKLYEIITNLRRTRPDRRKKVLAKLVERVMHPNNSQSSPPMEKGYLLGQASNL
jgi:dsDNA-binding SOS-regulon protein